MLPKEIDCPLCNTTLELEESERKTHEFVCPHCKNKVHINDEYEKADFSYAGAYVDAQINNNILKIIVIGKCEPGSEGNYIGDLVDKAIESNLSKQITQITLDLTNADYSFGNYFLSGRLPFALFDNRNLIIYTNTDNFEPLKSLFSFWDSKNFDVQIINQDT